MIPVWAKVESHYFKILQITKLNQLHKGYFPLQLLLMAENKDHSKTKLT